MFISDRNFDGLVQVIAGSNSIEFSRELATKLNWDLIIPHFKIFKDGESSLKLPKLPAKKILIVQSLYNPQDTHLFQLFNLISTVKRLGTEHITLYTPYLAYARSDREVLQFEAISAKTVIEIFERLGVNHLITLDVHNPEIAQFVENMKFTNLYPVKSVSKFFREALDSLSDVTIVSPDKGAIERAKKLAKGLNLPYAYLDKVRDPISGEIEITTGGMEIHTSSVIIVDDIVATGASLVQASSLLMIMGVTKIHYFITHFLSTEALDRIKEISDGIVIASHSVPSLISEISTIDDLCEVLLS
ncbi:MAG: ribose-phosphate pyrophosphokinase [Candidatus Heimdallarchaeota archaeon]|nr:ribose-phosphate pyrophosphokinase [Candidatus Heimdallarchaeota archaeon]